MNWLNKLPGSNRVPPGREWALWKRLPAILAWGTTVPLLIALALWWAAPTPPTPAEERGVLLLIYQLIGLVVLHWTLVVVMAIGCILVMVMKSPAYVADSYPPPGRDPMG
jgi:hypothetical protein